MAADDFKIFVNDQSVQAAAGMTVVDAVRLIDPELANALSDGSAYATDGVGRRITPDGEVERGSIFRVVKTARRTKRSSEQP